MFDKFGQPHGYGQYSPFQDQPKITTPGQPGRPRTGAGSTLDQAIAGPGQSSQGPWLKPGVPATVNPPAPPQSPLEANPNTGIFGGGAPAAAKKQRGMTNGQTHQDFFMGLTAGKPPSPAVLTSLLPQLQAAGWKPRPNAKGVLGKMETPDGEIIDVIEAADAGGKNWQWLRGGPKGAAGAQGGGLLGMLMGQAQQTEPTITLAPTSSSGQMSPLQSAIRQKQY